MEYYCTNTLSFGKKTLFF